MSCDILMGMNNILVWLYVFVCILYTAFCINKVFTVDSAVVRIHEKLETYSLCMP
jgi:hypothetical protein